MRYVKMGHPLAQEMQAMAESEQSDPASSQVTISTNRIYFRNPSLEVLKAVIRILTATLLLSHTYTEPEVEHPLHLIRSPTMMMGSTQITEAKPSIILVINFGN